MLTPAVVEDLNAEELIIVTEALANPVLKKLLDKHIQSLREAMFNLDIVDAEQLRIDYAVNRELLNQWQTFKEVAEGMVRSAQEHHQLIDDGEIDLTQAQEQMK